MNKLIKYVLFAAGFSLLFLGCGKKNSDEACQHETSMNLDSGNYDAVLSSGMRRCHALNAAGSISLGTSTTLGFDLRLMIFTVSYAMYTAEIGAYAVQARTNNNS